MDFRFAAALLLTAVSCSAPPPAVPFDPAQALDTYRATLGAEASHLEDFADSLSVALKTGDTGRARELYGPARAAFGHLGPAARLVPEVRAAADQDLHAREAVAWAPAPSVPAPSSALPALKTALAGVALTPEALVASAATVLEDLRAGALRGLAEPVSRTDLWDLEGGLQGVEWVWQAFSGPVRASDPALGRQLDAQFSLLYGQLSTLKRNDVLRSSADVYPKERASLDAGIVVLTDLWKRFAANYRFG